MATTTTTAAIRQHDTTHAEARHGAQEYLNSRFKNGAINQNPQPFDIPVIDISPSFSPSLDARKAVAAQIHSACITSGFFHITGHGVAEDTRQAILRLAERFFHDLPAQKKEALHVKHSAYFRGWEPADYTYVNPADWHADADGAAAPPETKQGFNWAYEPGLDPTGGDGLYRELDGGARIGNVWPAEPDLPGFYAGVRAYYSAVLALARHLFRLFALALALPEDHFDAMTTHPGGLARLMYYPPAAAAADGGATSNKEEIGLGAHSDYECFTILLCSAAPGLEILSPANAWVSIPPVDGSFIVNVADFLMRWTNGVYKSTVHRVVNRTRDERYSVPFFFSINYDLMVETLPSCITPENPSRYPPVRAGEYILERLRATAKEG